MMDATSSNLEVSPAFEKERWTGWLCNFVFPVIQTGADWLGSSTAEHGLGSLCGKKLNINQQCALAANSANSLLGCINSIPRRLRDSAFIRPHLHLAFHTSNTRTIMIRVKSSAESHQNVQGVEAFVLGRAEGSGLIWPGDEVAPGDT